MLTWPTLMTHLKGMMLWKVDHLDLLKRAIDIDLLIISSKYFSILVLDIGPTSVHSIWLNGKLEGNGFVVTKDSKWDIVIGISDIADTEWIGGSAPIFDSNAERNLYIRPQDKKLGADPGDFTSKEFICKFEKLGTCSK